jgi:hypothetical protein
VFGFLVWLVCAASWSWRRIQHGDSVLDITLSRAGSIAIVLLLLHSVVDYPLRSPALMILFALSCAYMVPLAGPARSRETNPVPAQMRHH